MRLSGLLGRGFLAGLPLLHLLPLASAQSSAAALAAELPSCALLCLVAALEHSTCSITNYNQTCVCTNAPLMEEVTLCVTANCTVKEALVTQNVTQTACGAVTEDKGPQAVAIFLSLGCISAACVLLRLGYKLFVAHVSLTMDDYTIFATILTGIPSDVISTHGTVPNGLGRNIWTLEPEQITSFLRFFYGMEILYFSQVALLKLSLLFFYLRIFPAKPVRLMLWGSIIFVGAWGLLYVLLGAFQCQPISYFWTNWDGEHEGHCLDSNAIGWSNAAISIALDIWMIAIPLAQLKTLNLHWRKKIGVAIMLLTGTFVTVVSVLRLSSLVSFGTTANATMANIDVTNWSAVEINIGIICACMPTLRLLLIRIFPALGGGNSAYGRGGYYVRSKDGFDGTGARSAVKSSNRSRALDDLSQSRTGTITTASVGKPGGSRTAADLEGAATGTGMALGRDHHAGPAKPGIVYEQSYAVRYDDDDETSLVAMRDLDRKAARTAVSENSL